MGIDYIPVIYEFNRILFNLSNLADDVNALYLTGRDHYDPGLTKNRTVKQYKGHVNTGSDLYGPQMMLFSAWLSQGTDTIAHGGFLAHPRRNTSGFATYLYPRSGAQLWGISRIKKSKIANSKDRTEVWIMYHHDKRKGWESSFENATTQTILLEEGDML